MSCRPTAPADDTGPEPLHGTARLTPTAVGLALAGLLAAFLIGFHPSTALAAPSGPGVVRAVLFYSPSCPHCHEVMAETLPPLQRQYGASMDLLTLDVTTQRGADLYGAAISTFRIPEGRIGVPTLIIGDVVLVGSGEIPDRLPALVAQMLAGGGSDWPAIPGLVDVVGQSPGRTGAAGVGDIYSPLAEALDRAARDPLGSLFAIVVLIGLFGVLARVGLVVHRRENLCSGPASCLIPPIALVGLGVAGYLAAVETSGGAAVCGPVGDCNGVHQSEFAQFLGIVPIAVLGLIGYVSIIGTWLAGRVAAGALAPASRVTLMGLAAAGTIFSIYLTFLEPFVIGATCAWCLASAALMGGLLVLAATPGPSRKEPLVTPRASRVRARGRSRYRR
jgi:uncharacterized membrane protein